MSFTIIDRRKSFDTKGQANRSKFLKRINNTLKKHIKEAIANAKVSDIVNNANRSVKIPIRDTEEPAFHVDQSEGAKQFVVTGNDQFDRGDRIPKPPSGGGQGGSGSGASQDGEGESEFSFVLSKEEFMDLFFDDLQLPNLTRKELAKVEEETFKRSGFTPVGAPSRLDMLQSMRQSAGRRFALRGPKRKKLKALQQELADLKAKLLFEADTDEATIMAKRIDEIEKEIIVLKRKLRAIPFIDDTDLRFRNYTKNKQPIFNAAMVCVMDVSGSMDEHKQDLAKRFFMLLYLFLYKSYDSIEIRFVRYHSTASEVDEEEFFYARDTGGTVTSTALDLAADIIREYPRDKWNVYVAHITDGDNWGEDNAVCKEILDARILPNVQRYFYVETVTYDEWPSDLIPLFTEYEGSGIVDIGKVKSITDIYPTFRGFFEGA